MLDREPGLGAARHLSPSPLGPGAPVSGDRTPWPVCLPPPSPPGRFAPALSFFHLAAHGHQRRDDLADLRPPRARLRGLPARSAPRVRCQVNADEPSAFLTKEGSDHPWWPPLRSHSIRSVSGI